MHVLGLDIGGANIKAAMSDGESCSVPFAFWRHREQLGQRLRALPLANASKADLIGLTMTAELADCFATKAEGVEFVVRSVQEEFPRAVIRVWLTSGEFAEPDDAIDLWSLTAAANWHALATWAGRAIPSGPALLVDSGSTTTDVVPIVDGVPVPQGRTDLERLAAGELIYTGVSRTPVSAIVKSVPLLFNDKEVRVPISSELFATALDVHVINDDIPEDELNTHTADGRPGTRANCRNRLAHQLCCDLSELTETQIAGVAQFVADTQISELQQGIRRQLDVLQTYSPKGDVRVLLSGSGAWLAERAVQELRDPRITSVSDMSAMFIRNVSQSAAAFAVARLVGERCADDLLPWSTLT